MSWLSELEREFKYECIDCKEESIYLLKQHDHDYTQPRLCVFCGKQAEYIGFNPIKVSMRSKVAFEKNGVKGYATSDGKGNVRYISAAKEHYMETGDIRPSYTKKYADHLKATGREDQLKTQSRSEIIQEREKNKDLSKLAKPVMAVPEDA